MTTQSPRAYTRIATAIIIAAVVIAVAIFAAAPLTTVTKTITVTPTASTSTTCAVCNPFVVNVSYSGTWKAVITGYNAGEALPAYQVFQNNITSTGSSSIYATIPIMTQTAESSLYVTVYKTDGGNGNLTVSIAYLDATRTNSTSAPYGSASAFLIVSQQIIFP